MSVTNYELPVAGYRFLNIMDIMEILGKVGFDWRMAVANLVNFLIIFWILKKYAFKPIQKVIKEREDKIAQGLEDATKAQSELQMAQQNYERTLTNARKEAQDIVAKAHEQGDSMLKKATAETEEKTTKIVSDARALIQKEKAQMSKELEHKTAHIAVQIAQKILGREIDIKSDETLIGDITK